MAEMEAAGRRFRLLAEGLVQLLRTRAKEKGSVRVAQTVIGSADVNPLKFLATTEDALAALVSPRGKGYLAPEDAIAASYRDLNDHQVRTWIALQSALRGMIDRFDPERFEKEADAAGTLKAILSGGRGARLWQLYLARYREIAKAAEDRFLGEVGADFRDAYEGNRRDE
jgi:type VI secretion system protein ImpI